MKHDGGKIERKNVRKEKDKKEKYKIFLVLLFVENSKEKENIHFPLFGNYIEKLRKIEAKFYFYYYF